MRLSFRRVAVSMTCLLATGASGCRAFVPPNAAANFSSVTVRSRRIPTFRRGGREVLQLERTRESGIKQGQQTARPSTTSKSSLLFSASSKTRLCMVQTRGLERMVEGATPLPGGMTLYCKAGPEGTELGDCPFTHAVQMVLLHKGLEYELKPCTAATKPQWLLDYYEGKMPALRHRKECYVETSVIVQYLDFFFTDKPLSDHVSKSAREAAAEATQGFFPAVAKYLKHKPDGDDEDATLRQGLETALQKLQDHLASLESTSDPLYLAGAELSMEDCLLAPRLFHMQIGLEAFKKNAIDVETQYPKVRQYMDTMFGLDIFQKSSYAKEMVVWGWSNARA